MDFRLRVFAEVARHLSFTKASKELQISQPAITKHVQELESMYGIQLFERSKGKIFLTRYGEIFLDYANDILLKYQELAREMELVANKLEGRLSIGADKGVQRVVSLVVEDFMTKFPDVTVTLFIGNSMQVEEALHTSRIDVAIIGKDGGTELSYLSSPDPSDKKYVVFVQFANHWISKNQKRAVRNL